MCCIEKFPQVEKNGGALGYASMQTMNMYIFRQTYQTTQDVRQMNYSFWRPITHFPYHDLWTLSCVRGGGVWCKHVSSFAGIMVMSLSWELFAYYSNEVSGFNTDPTRLSAWRPPHADSVRGSCRAMLRTVNTGGVLYSGGLFSEWIIRLPWARLRKMKNKHNVLVEVQYCPNILLAADPLNK